MAYVKRRTVRSKKRKARKTKRIKGGMNAEEPPVSPEKTRIDNALIKLKQHKDEASEENQPKFQEVMDILKPPEQAAEPATE